MRKVLCKRKMYVHTSKESNWDHLEEMIEEGLFVNWTEEDKEEFRDNFIYTNYEVELEMEIYTDGTSKIIAVDGDKVL